MKLLSSTNKIKLYYNSKLHVLDKNYNFYTSKLKLESIVLYVIWRHHAINFILIKNKYQKQDYIQLTSITINLNKWS